jgi:hypothetical protein
LPFLIINHLETEQSSYAADMMATPTPFQVNIPESSIKSLHDKLSLATFPDELTDANWDLGAPLSHVKRLSEYWYNGFDWRAQEAKLNKLPQFKTKIATEKFGELDVHFVHQKSKVDGAIPLLFVHGCEFGFPIAVFCVIYVRIGPEWLVR